MVNRQDWAICESRAARDVVARLHPRLVRADGGRLRRHPPLAPARRLRSATTAVDVDRGRRLRRHRARCARLRRGLAPGLARPLGGRARAVRARPQPRRLPRHLADPAAQLPHARLRTADAGGVRRLGTARGRVGRVAGHRGRRPRPVPARLRDRRRTTTSRRCARWASTSSRSTPPRSPRRFPVVRRARRHAAGSSRSAAAIVPAARGTAAMQRLATEAGATLLGSHPGHLGDRPRLARDRRGRRYVVHLPRRGGRRRRVDQPGAGRARRAGPAHGDAGAGDLLRAGRPHAVRLDAAVDLDGRAELLRLPLLRRGDRQGGPGLRRAAGRPRRPHHRPRPGDARAAGVVHGLAAAGLRASRCARCAASTR